MQAFAEYLRLEPRTSAICFICDGFAQILIAPGVAACELHLPLDMLWLCLVVFFQPPFGQIQITLNQRLEPSLTVTGTLLTYCECSLRDYALRHLPYATHGANS